MQQRRCGRRQNARDAQNNQREVEAHDEPVVAVDTRHQRGRKTAQRDQLKQVLRCNRDIGNLTRDCRAGGDGNAGVRLGEREENIACDLNDTSWFEEIDAADGAVFFAAGVFYYFLREQVRMLLSAMANAFPGAKLVFDAAGKKAVKLMLKTWIRSAKIQDVGAYFSVTNAEKELSAWLPGAKVSSRGYMLGYHDLNLPNVSPFFRFLSKVGDNTMHMQIVRVDF